MSSPVQELQLFFPEWVEALPPEHPIPAGLYHAVGQGRPGGWSTSGS